MQNTRTEDSCTSVTDEECGLHDAGRTKDRNVELNGTDENSRLIARSRGEILRVRRDMQCECHPGLASKRRDTGRRPVKKSKGTPLAEGRVLADEGQSREWSRTRREMSFNRYAPATFYSGLIGVVSSTQEPLLCSGLGVGRRR